MPPRLDKAALVRNCSDLGLSTVGNASELRGRIKDHAELAEAAANFAPSSSSDSSSGESGESGESGGEEDDMEARREKHRAVLNKRLQARRRASRATAKGETTANNANYSAGNPRKTATLIALEDNLLGIGDIVESRDEAELRSAEWFERDGKFQAKVVKRVERLELACVECADDDGACAAVVKWQRQSDGKFKLTNISAHTCPTALPTPTPEHGSTAYDTKHLVALIQDQVVTDPQVPGKVLRTALAPYLKRRANSALISRLRKAAFGSVYGDTKTQLRELPGIAAAFNGKGHKMGLEFWVAADLKGDLLQSLKDVHKYKQQKLHDHKKDFEKFDFQAALVSLPVLDGHAKYLKSVTFTPSTAIAMYPKMHPFSSSDFASMKGGDGGNLGSRYGLDANRNLVDMTHSLWLGNEDKPAWRNLDAATKADFTDYDSSEQVDTRDGFKGGPEAFDDIFDHASLFQDTLHRAKVVAARPASKGGGKVGKAHYLKAVHARSFAGLQKVKAAMPPDVAAYLARTRDEEQYMCTGPKSLRGRSTSSYSESGNNANSNVRKLATCPALLALVQNMKRRFDENKAEAANCASAVPTRLMAAMAGAREQVARIPADKIRFTNEQQTTGTVPLLSRPGKCAGVNIGKMEEADKGACDRSCSVPTGLPCGHQFALVDAGSHELAEYMHKFDTTEGWIAQYAGVEFQLPSEADFEDQEGLWGFSICTVPPFKRKRGRLSLKRKRGFLEKGSKKAKGTCSRCWRIGHTKRSSKCPMWTGA
jgi:hypothetical protein